MALILEKPLFEQVYEERFERQYGFFRPYVRKVIYRYPWPRPACQMAGRPGFDSLWHLAIK